jgi:cytochrome c553
MTHLRSGCAAPPHGGRSPRLQANLRLLGPCAAALLMLASVGATAQTVTPVMTQAPAKAAVCNACHGEGGRSTVTTNPILAGQTSRYMYLQLRDFQEGRRSDPQMSPMVKDLSRDELRELSDWFAQQKPPIQNFKVDEQKAKLGKVKADDTLCTMCHLGGFKGQNEIPRVAGQHYDYIVKQLQDFKAKRRTNDAGNMTSVSGTMTDADIENVAHYLVGL